MHLLGQVDPLDQAILPVDNQLISILTSNPELGLWTHSVPSQTGFLSGYHSLDIERLPQACINELGTDVPSQLKAAVGDLEQHSSTLNAGDPVANMDPDDFLGTEHGTRSGVPSQAEKQVNCQVLDSEHGMSVPSHSKSTLGKNILSAVGDGAATLNPSAVPFVASNRILGALGHDDEDDRQQVLQV